MYLDIANITEATLQGLIQDRIFESKELEYKDYSFVDGKIEDRVKTKLMQEIVAFANTYGGQIVIGIKEDQDQLPTEISGTNAKIGDFDGWLSSFRQIVLSRIRPHLHGIECTPVSLQDGDLAIVITVPKSLARPHSFWNGNKDEFFIRHANGIAYMDIDDLRNAFLYSDSIQTRIQRFKQDRISMLVSGETIPNLSNKGKLVIYIIPEWSFESGNTIDLKKAQESGLFWGIASSTGNNRYNSDGYCIFHTDFKTHMVETYSQLFHNGIIEAVEARLFSNYRPNQVYNWSKYQDAVFEALLSYEKLLSKLGVPKPWHIAGFFLNANGYSTAISEWCESSRIERDIIQSQEGIWDDDVSLSQAIKPVFDTLSNAFGFEGSFCFDDAGNFIQK